MEPTEIQQKNRLKRIDLAIYSGCNLRCKHCYQGGLKNKNILLGLEKIKEILSDAKKLGASDVTITGGEPLLHPYFTEILRFASGLDYRMRILTNGTLLTETTVNEFLKYAVEMQISLDGTKKIHEKIRGKDTYDKTVQGIKLCTSRDIQVIVNTQLTQEILQKFNDYIDLLEAIGVPEVIFTITGLFGDAENNQIFTPSNCIEQIRKILSTDLEQRKKFQEPHECGALLTRLAVNYDGVVYPCDFFKSINHHSLGNIYQERLQDIYAGWIKSNCGLIRYQRKGVRECNSCEFKNFCQACPARIFSIYKNFTHPDPLYCSLFGRIEVLEGIKKIPLSKLIYGRI